MSALAAWLQKVAIRTVSRTSGTEGWEATVVESWVAAT
jgi:hypothetical protein